MLKRRFHNQRGVAAVEFALVSLVLLLFLGGIIDFGIIFFVNHLAGNGAREGARMAAASETIDNAAVQERALRFVPRVGLFQNVTATVTQDLTNNDDGCHVTVNISGEVPHFFLSPFVSSPVFEVDRTVTMRYEHVCSQ